MSDEIISQTSAPAAMMAAEVSSAALSSVNAVPIKPDAPAVDSASASSSATADAALSANTSSPAKSEATLSPSSEPAKPPAPAVVASEPAKPPAPAAAAPEPAKPQAPAAATPEPKKPKGPKYSSEMAAYFKTLRDELDAAIEMATHARQQGLDPERFVEITPAPDVAARVEGLVGPKGIAAVIRAMEETGKSREIVAHDVMIKILKGEVINGQMEALIDQGVRTAVSILTEGVLVAPTEGIASIQVCSPSASKAARGNPDGTSYLAVYFAGPIRSAGGTVAALTVVLADAARRHFKLGDYRPTETEIERYVEEINLYNDRCAHLQYKPSDDDIRHIVRSCPVCVEGEPTEAMEVSVYRDLPRMETNRVRGGIALVVCEGIAQKAAKVLKYTKKVGLDWSFLEALARGVKKGSAGSFELKADPRFLEELVAGRPIFSYPMRPGGFRLRYGRSRATGIAGKGIHPAAMYILDSFPAIGTQLKVERPGKGTVVSACDAMMGPIVKLKDGSVVDVTSSEQAIKLVPEVAEILFLGDMLISFGDFLKSNHPLVPSGIVEEWWAQMAQAKGVKTKPEWFSLSTPDAAPSAFEAFKLSSEHGLPLHPRFTYFWHDLTPAQLQELATWLCSGQLQFDLLRTHPKSLQLESAPAKRWLEFLGVPHAVREGQVVVDGPLAYAVLTSLGLLADKKLTLDKFNKTFDPTKTSLENVNTISGFTILSKAPVYVGTRMGRPEKARERKMAPPIHVLFPIGHMNKNRSVLRAWEKMRTDERKEGRGLEVEIARLKCTGCGKINYSITCAWCSQPCAWQRVCGQCGRSCTDDTCGVCKGKANYFEKRSVDFVRAVETARTRLGLQSMPDVKGVQGMISNYKIPELLEKGFLRSKHNLTIFRDSTCRFDATNMPLTHFTPREIQVAPARLVELGYTHDIEGKPLRGPDQILSLKVQDVILAEEGRAFFFKVTQYIDDLLVNVYQMRPYYKLKTPNDLVGQLTIGLSPHTSAGVLSRIIGFTKAHVGYAHPYFHCAKRRNTDGDEDCLMLMMDALLNFSRRFLPATRGGTMDAPLVLTTQVDPTEVDDEVHSMEAVSQYPLSFYEACAQFTSPSDVPIPLVKNLLNTPAQYEDLHYTHAVRAIDEGPLMTAYISLEKKMTAKVAVEFALEDKIRAVDPADVALRVLLSHFLPDMYGNLRSFSRQMFRCSECNAKFRRVPLVGHCNKCNGKLQLTIYKGGIEKYLQPSRDLVERYHLPAYMKQRLELIQKDIDSVFTDEKSRQAGLADFM